MINYIYFPFICSIVTVAFVFIMEFTLEVYDAMKGMSNTRRDNNNAGNL